MPWFLSDSLREYSATVHGLLSERPAEHTILLGAMETLRAAGPGAFGGSAPLFGWWPGPDGEVSAAFLHTPPFPMVLTSVPGPDSAAALAQALAVRSRAVGGVNADPRGAEAFARAWHEVTGDAVELHMRNRLFRLGELRWPDPRPAGQARVPARPTAACSSPGRRRSTGRRSRAPRIWCPWWTTGSPTRA